MHFLCHFRFFVCSLRQALFPKGLPRKRFLRQAKWGLQSMMGHRRSPGSEGLVFDEPAPRVDPDDACRFIQVWLEEMSRARKISLKSLKLGHS